MVGDDPLLRWRDEFPILLRYTYLISNSLGAMPRGAYDSLHQYADEWASEGVTAWHHWLPEVGRFGDEIGRLFGAPPGTVILHQNISALQAILASALDYPPERPDPVTPRDRSPQASAKTAHKHQPDGEPIRDFTSLLGHLATLTRNTITFNDTNNTTIKKLSEPTQTQRRAFELIGAKVPLKIK